MLDKRIRMKIKENLIMRGITQTELAKTIGVREATISDMSNGKHNSIRLDITLKNMSVFSITDFNEILEIVHVSTEREEKEEGEGVLI